MLKNDLYEKTLNYVNNLFPSDLTGHDINHAIRVYKMALIISREYSNVNDEVIMLASLLHDCDDYKFFKSNCHNVEKFLDSIPLSIEEKKLVESIISSLGYHLQVKGIKQSSIEGQIVQDADLLDAIGAIGISRCFAYGASSRRDIYKEGVKDTSIQHFYDKLLHVGSYLNTPKGKEIGIERTKIIEDFLKEFMKEWNI